MVPTERDNGENRDEEVMSSQRSERQDIVLDSAEGITSSSHAGVSAEESSPPPRRSINNGEQDNQEGKDDVLMDTGSRDAKVDMGQLVSAADAVADEPAENGTITGDRKPVNAVVVESNSYQGEFRIGEVEQQPEIRLPEAEVPKTEAVLEAEPDDEFDDDPWFDAACLKSIDAIDASAKHSTTIENSLSGAHQSHMASTPRISPPPLSLRNPPTNQVAKNHVQLPSFSQDFVDTRKAEEIDVKEIPVTVGFSTARGKKVAVPTTSAALQNARTAKLMQELLDIQNEVVIADKSGADVVGADVVGKINEDFSLVVKDAQYVEQMQHVSEAAVMETPTKARSSAFAFTTAGGSELGDVSASARAKVDSIFQADSQSSLDAVFPGSAKIDDVPAERAPQKASLFATLSGSALAAPSASAQEKTAALFAGPSQGTSQPTDYILQPANPVIISLALPHHSFETPTKSVSRLGTPVTQTTAFDVTRPTTLRPTSLQDISNLQPSSPAREYSVSTFKTPASAKMTHRASQAKPFQTPLPSHRQTRMSPAPAPSTGIGLSPALPRRVGLGMTPRTLSGLRERPRFVSPFRTVVHDKDGESVGSPNMKPRPGMRAIFSTPSVKQPKLPVVTAVPLQPCFQLSCKHSSSQVKTLPTHMAQVQTSAQHCGKLD